MGEFTWLDRIKEFIEQTFCKHNYKADIWNEGVYLRCSKCCKSQGVYDVACDYRELKEGENNEKK